MEFFRPFPGTAESHLAHHTPLKMSSDHREARAHHAVWPTRPPPPKSANFMGDFDKVALKGENLKSSNAWATKSHSGTA